MSILESCCLRPTMRNSVSEELRVRLADGRGLRRPLRQGDQ